jgi:hypothetical protein
MTMRARASVPGTIISRLRSISLSLPETHEETAWVGVRWRIRTKIFVHVLMIDGGWPPAYARAAGADGPACVLTFRSPMPAVDNEAFHKPPFFKPVWWPDIAGMILGSHVDWREVSALITVSYRMLAPKKLAERMR